MKQNLRRILLSAALLGLPFLSVQALDWYPKGDSVSDDGFALTGSDYVAGDYIANDTPADGFNQPLDATDDDSELNIYGTLHSDTPNPDDLSENQVLDGDDNPQQVPLKVNGNVVLSAITNDMTVNVL